MSVIDIVALIKDIVLALSAAGTLIIASKGLSTWRKELKGKSEYQLAKEILKSVYRVREAFKRVRLRVIYSDEYPKEVLGPHGHVLKGKEYEAADYIYKSRWEGLSKVFLELEERNLDAQVEWENEFKYTINDLRECRSELLSTIQIMLYNKKSTVPSGKEEYDKSILYDFGPDCGFTQKINKAIGEFENLLRPKIQRSRFFKE